MNNLEDMLTNFFVSIAKKDFDTLNKLQLHKNFSISDNYWQFTLPDLYNFLLTNLMLEEDLGYEVFRKALFKTSINQTLKAYGAVVIIDNNKHMVDKSSYTFHWGK